MALQPPMTAIELDKAKKNRLEEKANHTVGVVWPDGRVTEHVCPPPGEEDEDGQRHGDVPVRWVNGEPAIWKPYRRKGLRMLKEVCELDGVPEVYEAWREVVRARITRPGMPVRGDVMQIYPPSVARLREAHRAGGLSDGLAFVIGEGITEDPEIEERMAKRAVELGIGDPRKDPKAKPDKAAKPAKPDKEHEA
jgi:hypothetical protein